MVEEARQAKGFLDDLTLAFILDLLTKPHVFLAIVVVLLATRYRGAAQDFILWLRESFSSVKVGDVSVEFQKLEARVEKAESQAQEALVTAKSLEVGRPEVDAVLSHFDAEAPALDLDKLATWLKPIGRTVAQPEAFIHDLAPGAPQAKAFGAVIVACEQPRPVFLEPLTTLAAVLADDPRLGGFRLKTVYRLVMAIEAVLRADNKLETPRLETGARAQAEAALKALQVNPRVSEDDERNGARGMGARIRRALSQVEPA